MICDRCDQDAPVTHIHPITGEQHCPTCRDEIEQNEAEAAHERRLADYYGGSGPRTLDDLQTEGLRIKRGWQ